VEILRLQHFGQTNTLIDVEPGEALRHPFIVNGSVGRCERVLFGRGRQAARLAKAVRDGDDADQMRVASAAIRMVVILKHVDERREEIPGLADPAPDFTLRDGDRNEVTLSSFRGQNVVLAFYALAFTGG